MNPLIPPFSSGQLSVVVAEDEPLLRNLLKRLLQDLGYRVAGTACNGLEAVEMTRSLNPDFLILDIVMPEMDGLEAARRIIAEREIPIVICSGSAKREHIEQAEQMGIRSFVPKPFSVNHLRTTLQLLGLVQTITPAEAS